MKIACIQSDVILGKSRANFENMKSKIIEAVKENVKVIVLPELWTTGYCLEEIGLHIGDQEEIISELQLIAKSNNVTLICGSFPIARENGVTNTLIVISKTGEIVKAYDKIHLFQLMNEHHYLQAGETDGLFEINGLTAAGFVCYDLRFPEWIGAHSQKGAKVLFFVAEWPIQRMNHWETLLKARAIENQCYVVACNRVGKDLANTFGGGSMIIDPWGEVISKGSPNEEIIFGEIDPKKVDEIRGTIPIFEDRREGIYKKLQKSN
ncbi:carbon-nitrogen hydrolase [Bacillus sp. AFS002410]|uniref:carbon-nitrogen family hydrolase n=1 Tax=Bacillus sp. AFS002410 TaxID=2033481 RepID=UPI000BF149E0|nr:carbon-nitrogen family hydrolase [Bacillus sp. AFS002410]PEJ47770.1 carbon-nitrogen hydrolase [Bacillus sp. AFS002410]